MAGRGLQSMKNDILVGKLNAHVQKIMNYCKGYTYEAFAADTKLIEACVFNLSQMGELAGKLDDAFSAKHSNIPWRHLYGLRNRIVHDYDGVNLVLIWEIIENDLPALKLQLEQILEQLH